MVGGMPIPDRSDEERGVASGVNRATSMKTSHTETRRLCSAQGIVRREFFLGVLAAAAGASRAAAGSERQDAMSHVVLLGDSVLDNGAYVGNGPDVVHQ